MTSLPHPIQMCGYSKWKNGNFVMKEDFKSSVFIKEITY